MKYLENLRAFTKQLKAERAALRSEYKMVFTEADDGEEDTSLTEDLVDVVDDEALEDNNEIEDPKTATTPSETLAQKMARLGELALPLETELALGDSDAAVDAPGGEIPETQPASDEVEDNSVELAKAFQELEDMVCKNGDCFDAKRLINKLRKMSGIAQTKESVNEDEDISINLSDEDLEDQEKREALFTSLGDENAKDTASKLKTPAEVRAYLDGKKNANESLTITKDLAGRKVLSDDEALPVDGDFVKKTASFPSLQSECDDGEEEEKGSKLTKKSLQSILTNLINTINSIADDNGIEIGEEEDDEGESEDLDAEKIAAELDADSPADDSILDTEEPDDAELEVIDTDDDEVDTNLDLAAHEVTENDDEVVVDDDDDEEVETDDAPVKKVTIQTSDDKLIDMLTSDFDEITIETASDDTADGESKEGEKETFTSDSFEMVEVVSDEDDGDDSEETPATEKVDESLKNGRECYECAHCKHTKDCHRSEFFCDYTEEKYNTWHLDVPKEAPCNGDGFELSDLAKRDDAVYLTVSALKDDKTKNIEDFQESDIQKWVEDNLDKLGLSKSTSDHDIGYIARKVHDEIEQEAVASKYAVKEAAGDMRMDINNILHDCVFIDAKLPKVSYPWLVEGNLYKGTFKDEKTAKKAASLLQKYVDEVNARAEDDRDTINAVTEQIQNIEVDGNDLVIEFGQGVFESEDPDTSIDESLSLPTQELDDPEELSKLLVGDAKANFDKLVKDDPAKAQKLMDYLDSKSGTDSEPIALSEVNRLLSEEWDDVLSEVK